MEGFWKLAKVRYRKAIVDSSHPSSSEKKIIFSWADVPGSFWHAHAEDPNLCGHNTKYKAAHKYWASINCTTAQRHWGHTTF
jgi:hypothetical protein